ncbi:MAG TPA: DUF3667 domain-containing protein [Burkholderiaceae bacterium]|nr:DUF3667 domain-containing protein [Burkholderiaceae bacterium]
MTDLHDPGDIGPPELVIGTVLAHGAAHAAHGHERLAACPNCGTPFAPDLPQPNFCPVCGQEAVLHPPSVAEFAHEFAGHYVAVEGPLWRTLWLLVGRPGQLTREYLHGRRRRYVLPLRLYLSASFLFFLVFKLLPSDDEAVKFSPNARHGDAAAAASSALAASMSTASAAASLPTPSRASAASGTR